MYKGYSQRKSTPKVKSGKVQRKNRHKEQRYPIVVRQQPGKGYRHVITKSDITNFVRILPDWEQLAQGLEKIILAQGEPDTSGWYIPHQVAICAWHKEGENIVYQHSFYEEHKELYKRLAIPTKEHKEYLGHIFYEKHQYSLNAKLVEPSFLKEFSHMGEPITKNCHIVPIEKKNKWEIYDDGYKYLLVKNEEWIDVYSICYYLGFTDQTIRAYQLIHILLHELGHHHDLITCKGQKHLSRGESYAEEYALRHENLIYTRYQEIFK